MGHSVSTSPARAFSQVDLEAARIHLTDVLASKRDDIVACWLEAAGATATARFPEIDRYVRSLVTGLHEVFETGDWAITQTVVDALAERRARESVGSDHGMQRALLAGRGAVKPFLDEHVAAPCDELFLDALHECLFRFFESYQGVRLASESERVHARIIKSLVVALEARDPYTKGHSLSVALMCQRISQAFSSTIDPMRAYLAGLLHDVGKVGIPDRILLKSGTLDAEERAIMEAHPQMGASILTPIRLYPDVVGAVYSHHENYDGSGYPHGLAREEIPEIARIIRVVDSFDAMTSARAYRPSMAVEDAVTEIRAKSGSLYDPATVDAFAEVVGAPGSVRELSVAALQIDLAELTSG